MGAGEGGACAPPMDCRDVDVGGDLSFKACCSATVDCGYELPMLDEENRMLFPQAEEFIVMWTGDPNSRCARLELFFGPRPGLWKHRVEVEGQEDILITPDCDSYTLGAFILPGCCLPDSTCGLSTDESWTTLESLAQGVEAPFNRPECVSAEVLNQQFRDSVVLEDFARTTAGGTCDYAALAAELPPRQ